MLPEELMREVKRLQIRARRRVDDLFGGEYHSAFRGQGVEFAEVRAYEPGDDVRSIDWNVTARAGEPFIKRFVEERQLTVVLAVDRSASGAFGSTGRTKARLAAEVAAVLATSAALKNDKVGLCLFAEEVDLYLPPRKGRTNTTRLLRELLSTQPSGTTDIAGALDHLARVLPRRTIVFIASDFDAPDTQPKAEAEWERPLRRLAHKHDVIALTITDPRELELPPVGLIELTDPETGRRTLINTGRSQRQRFAERARRDTAARDARLTRCGIDRVDLSTGRPFAADLMAYLRRRERRR